MTRDEWAEMSFIGLRWLQSSLAPLQVIVNVDRSSTKATFTWSSPSDRDHSSGAKAKLSEYLDSTSCSDELDWDCSADERPEYRPQTSRKSHVGPGRL
jgi:hypothetical protein